MGRTGSCPGGALAPAAPSGPGAPPDADLAAEDNATALDAPRGSDPSPSSADEDRIERALVELGAAPADALSDTEPE